jgi:4-hydroxythreonine-4-phosphate dehydrogenase
MTESSDCRRPRLALLMGDVAGVGPEVVARVLATCGEASDTLVVGHPGVLARALDLVGLERTVHPVDSPRPPPRRTDRTRIDCWNPSAADVADIPPAVVDARCGRAAADWLLETAAAALDGHVDAVVTAPLNKAALAAAGIDVPGHTELLARACRSDPVAMMLYLPPGNTALSNPHGLGVAHVTLHTSIASVPGLLSVEAITGSLGLLDGFLRQLGCPAPRIGVCALNPHAGEDGLFGDEEQTTIAPAVAAAVDDGLDARGPFPADTLLRRAVAGEFEGVLAMYHDQGHIALKLVGFDTAVNVTLGLPLIRTSPSHGTAFDIAWQGIADPAGMQAAVDTAVRLCQNRTSTSATVAG